MARIEIDIPWNQFEDGVRAATSRAVRAAAFDVIAEASENIRNVAPHERDGEIVTDLIDTGAMLNSGYVVTSSDSGRSQAISGATAKQPGVSIGLPDPEPIDELEAQANYAAGYAEYVEARYPFLEPAAEAVRQKVERILERELQKEGFLTTILTPASAGAATGWSNVNNVLAQDNAVATLAAGAEASAWLPVRLITASRPERRTVGYVLEPWAGVSTTSTLPVLGELSGVRLEIAISTDGVTPLGSAKSVEVYQQVALETAGAADDVWGTSLGPADINSGLYLLVRRPSNVDEDDIVVSWSITCASPRITTQVEDH